MDAALDTAAPSSPATDRRAAHMNGRLSAVLSTIPRRRSGTLPEKRPRRAPRETASARPGGPSVDDLAAGWRGALDAAEGALQAARDSLPPAELSTRRQQLVAERASTLQLLKAVASERGASTRFLHLVPRRDLRRVLDLPAGVSACVFELNGVLVASAELHVAAWQQTFDEFLLRLPAVAGRHVAPFHPNTDYAQHIHGKPRLDGVVAFLESRGISLPRGTLEDAPGLQTLHGLANRKNEVLVHLIDVRGVRAFEDSRHYLETVVEAGLRTAVVSASANSERILERAGLTALVDECIDGRTMVEQHLRKRPAPDVLVAACRALGVEPGAAAAFETTPDGVAAARAADFAVVVAVDRGGRALALHAAGADVVTSDLGVLLESRVAA